MMGKQKMAMAIAIFLVALFLVWRFIPTQENYEELPETDLFSLAQKTANQGDCDTAITYYETLLAKDPRHATAWEFLSDCQIELERFEKAVESMEKAYDLQQTERYRNKLEYLYQKTDSKNNQ